MFDPYKNMLSTQVHKLPFYLVFIFIVGGSIIFLQIIYSSQYYEYSCKLKCNNHCSSWHYTNDPYWVMIIFVESDSENFVRRELIRRTWASVKYLDGRAFHTYFVVGKTRSDKTKYLLKKEMARYQDIIQINKKEHYRNLVFKSLAGIEWAFRNAKDNYFVTITDDIVMLDITKAKSVVDYHKDMMIRQGWGDFPILCMHGRWRDFSRPVRNQESKKYVSFKQYKWPFYPRHCSGKAYTLSAGMAKKLWTIYSPAYLVGCHRAFITGILRQNLGMPIGMIEQSVALVAKDFVDTSTMLSSFGVRYQEILRNITNTCACRC